MKQRSIDMTEGPLFKNIVLFSIPLVLSNVLQVLFNMSDVAVVGRFAGKEALGAVGSCSTLVLLFTGLLIGMGSGINSLAARHIGAGDNVRLHRVVHSALLISVIYGILIAAVGIFAARPLLHLLGTKDELIAGAELYTRVYLLGAPALAIYNYGNGILGAAGDSRRPLLYLALSGVLNIGLNLFFVIVCQWAVLGVAVASVASQYLSALLVLIRLFTCSEHYRASVRELRFDRAASASILALGLPAGLQNSIFAIANLFIQSAVNSFDTVMVEGNSAAANADALVYDMMAAFYMACTAFMAQNYGAKKRDRVLKSYGICLSLSFGFALLFGVFLFFGGRQFLSLFTTDAAVIDAGMKRLSIMAFSYCVSAFMDCTIAASRGLGKTVIPTAVVISGSCLFRILWIYTVFAHFRTIPSLYLLYIFSWTLTAIGEIIYFLHVFRRLLPKESTPSAGLPSEPASDEGLAAEGNASAVTAAE